MYFNKQKRPRIHDDQSLSDTLEDINDRILEGDTVIMYESHNTFSRHVISRNGKLCNSFGEFHYPDMIGKEYGVKLHARNTTGWIVALRPTPELWIKSIDKRTQIVHEMDCNFITFRLDLKPGDVVIESGTGSGAMSLAICRCVAPTGHVHSFEFNASRVCEARKDFDELMLADIVSVTHRNVCDDGFSLPEVRRNSVDAIFLDLPSPWTAVPHTTCMLKPGVGRLCSYSPCIEQVKKTVVELNRLGFHSLETVETRLRMHDIHHPCFLDLNGNDGEREVRCKPADNCRGHTAYLTFAMAPMETMEEIAI